MKLHCLLPSTEWDFPFFKVLARNDTAEGSGNQAGVLIPKELRKFFPGLDGPRSSTSPTVDHRINAQLFVENEYKGTVDTRYQFQTWGGERNPESRVTDNLGPMRIHSRAEDVLVMQRNIDRLDYYKLTLVRRSSPGSAEVIASTNGRRWGVLLSSTHPVTQSDLEVARADEAKLESAPFQLIDPSAGFSSITVKRLARSIAFRSTVLGEYEKACAVCGESLRSPSGLIEVDAAHIVPRSLMGADDARNGFALCKRHHWAFDKGLFGIGENRRVIVPDSVASIAANAELARFEGNLVTEARTMALRVHPSAYKWHRENLLIR